MTQGLHHLAVRCADLAACERFYVEVLGLPVSRRWPADGGGDRSVWLDLGGGALLMLERAAAAPVEAPFQEAAAGLHLAALRIAPSERSSWEARLAAAGVPVVQRTPFTLYLRDPEGNRLGLSHWPEAAP